MDRRHFLKGLVATASGLLVPEKKFFFLGSFFKRPAEVLRSPMFYPQNYMDLLTVTTQKFQSALVENVDGGESLMYTLVSQEEVRRSQEEAVIAQYKKELSQRTPAEEREFQARMYGKFIS